MTPRSPRPWIHLPSLTFWAIAWALLLFPIGAWARPEGQAKVMQTALNFKNLQPDEQVVAAVVLDVKDGFHIQSSTPTGSTVETGNAKEDQDAKDEIRLAASFDNNPAIKAYVATYPPGKSVKLDFDPRPYNILDGKVVIYLYFQVDAKAAPGPLTLTGKVHYQACDANSCRAPTDAKFSIDTTVIVPGPAVPSDDLSLFKNIDPTMFSKLVSSAATAAPTTAQGEPDSTTLFGKFKLTRDSYALAFIAAFIAGIIFNAVPCVLPVLPLKAIGFYEVSQHNRAKSIAFGAVFSLGLIASFGVLALLIVVKKLFGWGEIYSNVYFNLGIVAVLLVMAVGTFGVFSVNLPTSVYNITPRHDTYLGNFLFGILTAVLSTPCTFGLFLGLLIWATNQPWYIGMPLVMTVGVGMASPYFVLSAFPEVARRFPRTGPWSELVKQLMAFLLLGSAVFFARRFIAPTIGAGNFWWLMFAVAAAGGIYLVARSFQLSHNFKARAIGVAIAALVIGGTFLIVVQLIGEPYEWTPYTQTAFDEARAHKRVVVVEFTAAWCTNCLALEARTLNNPQVVKIVKDDNVAMLRVDNTHSDAPGWPLLRTFIDPSAIPFTVVYGPGTPQGQHLLGIYSVDQLTAAINQASHPATALR